MSIPEIALLEAGYSKEEAKKINSIVSQHCLTRTDLRNALAKHKIETDASLAPKPKKRKKPSMVFMLLMSLFALGAGKSVMLLLPTLL